MPAILIACEGRETEPNYVNGLCDALSINRANVTLISGDGETDALSLVQKAKRRFETDRDFDAVFVVCDCAGEDLTQARQLAARPLKHVAGHAITIELIVNRPCFELWLLLHFEYVARPLTAQQTLDLLRRHLPDYDKADRQIFAKAQAGFEQASARTSQLKAELAAIGVQSPDTDMPKLIECLIALRRR